MQTTFHETEIRKAERLLEKALESLDPTEWVYCYTEDATFVGPDFPAVQGREALLQMAGAMKPLSAVSITALQTEGSGNLVYTYGVASWVSGRSPDAGRTTNVRFAIIWRKEADDQWRVALEMLNHVPTTG
jgi:ketosteroid isomerase-like protein